jgi:hypothetical protein
MSEHRHPPIGWNGGWQPDPASVRAIAELPVGVTIQVVKRAPDGRLATTYPAVRVETSAPSPWVELQAVWVVPNVTVAGLEFVPGDLIREYFSSEHPFNAFAVIAPEGYLRGWYGNVTYPATVEVIEDVHSLVWHDLYLDAVILTDGSLHLLDDDELAASGIPAAAPTFAVAIEQARQDLIAVIPELAPELV